MGDEGASEASGFHMQANLMAATKEPLKHQPWPPGSKMSLHLEAPHRQDQSRLYWSQRAKQDFRFFVRRWKYPILATVIVVHVRNIVTRIHYLLNKSPEGLLLEISLPPAPSNGFSSLTTNGNTNWPLFSPFPLVCLEVQKTSTLMSLYCLPTHGFCLYFHPVSFRALSVKPQRKHLVKISRLRKPQFSSSSPMRASAWLWFVSGEVAPRRGAET